MSSEFLCSHVTKATLCTFPPLKRITEQTSCFIRKLAESSTAAAFFSMKDQQVHLGTSVLAERGCEMEGTEKKEGKQDTLV